MLRSLVGSEMCIRDSCNPYLLEKDISRRLKDILRLCVYVSRRCLEMVYNAVRFSGRLDKTAVKVGVKSADRFIENLSKMLFLRTGSTNTKCCIHQAHNKT